MKLFSIDTGYFKLDGGAMFGVVPKSIWNKLNPADESNLCTWALRCLLVQDEDRLILIDTGLGNKQDAKFFSHYQPHGNDTLEGSLQKHGFTVNDITDVILTHLHFDHCGGAIRREGDRLIPAFPNAVYWSNQAHWNWATHPNDREKASFLKENIQPIEQSGRLKFIDYSTSHLNEQLSDPEHLQSIDSVSFSKNISIRFVNGHTRAMMLPQINYQGRTIVYMADLLPSAAHLPLAYVMSYDMFPLTTLKEKKLFIGEAAANNYLLFFEHDAKTPVCEVAQDEKGRPYAVPVAAGWI